MSDPFFFGYGSLVNRDTHEFEQAHPATVRGWRRSWRYTTLRTVAFLTVNEAPGHSIDGLIAAVPDADWAALDIRERAYDRLHLEQADISHEHPARPTVQMYKVRGGNDADPGVAHPILLSYLDTVVKGYLDVFGAEGVDRFFTSTDGWHSPIMDDRKDPIYPRFQSLSRPEKVLVDTSLDNLNARRIAAVPLAQLAGRDHLQ